MVQSRAVASKACLLVLYWFAISGTRGSSGLGSVRSEDIDSKTREIVRAGLHWSFKMSRQIAPFLLIYFEERAKVEKCRGQAELSVSILCSQVHIHNRIVLLQ